MKKFKVMKSIPLRDSDALDRYLNEISRINLLSVEEEAELTHKIRNGDALAVQKLIKSNLRFVVTVAKKYQDSGLKLGDLISEGNIGLIRAAERFDDTKGFRFISFAVWWIRQSILLAIAEQRRLVRLPGSQLAINSKVKQAIAVLEQQLERMPTAEEISEYTTLPEDKVLCYLDGVHMPYSLDQVVDEDSGFTLMDIVGDKSMPASDHLTLAGSLAIDIKRALNVLPKREQQIVELFYGINGCPQTSLDDMGPILNLGKERIRQLKDKAHKTLTLNRNNALVGYFNQDSN